MFKLRYSIFSLLLFPIIIGFWLLLALGQAGASSIGVTPTNLSMTLSADAVAVEQAVPLTIAVMVSSTGVAQQMVLSAETSHASLTIIKDNGMLDLPYDGIIKVIQTGSIPGGTYPITLTATTSDSVIAKMIQVTTAHKSYLPSVFSGYCAAPFIDHFDSNSGWPIVNNDDYSAEIANGVYAFDFVKSNRSSIVTRGDRLELRSTLMEVLFEIKTGASHVGIVYGIQPDFARFHTFELYPSLGLWANFRFDAATGGWRLLTFEQTDVTFSGQNRIIAFPTEDGLEIDLGNGLDVALLPFEEGMVGLIAVSEEANTRIEFDRYVVSGPNCPPADFGNTNSSRVLDFATNDISAEFDTLSVANRADLETMIEQLKAEAD